MSQNKTEIQYTWPSDFPEGIPENCEPSPAEGVVYRLVRTIPPTEIDFQKHRDEHPDYVYVTKDKPLSFGMSFFTSLAKLKRKTRNYPAPEQYKLWQTVCGELVPELGVIKEKSGHVTLWAQEGALPHQYINEEAIEA
ncbi:hypothetical protein [Alteromonas oceanisediminis]|uniref:hypothetical protein n=1 Tax=Alteromonas oceanisediminis TaxID=2836180 RepID=UPI001BDB1757|nr:hypothetical protein [Alteromonas oceanisediminis]MBT0585580.1 hypothetical protein [Alteromonas oceanisediminis]